ncbi:MAG: glycosyltransferase [Phycisphaeraceae bacterium]
MTTPLRITYLAPFFDPATQFGGPITSMRQLCRGMAGRGHQVRVVTTDLGVGPDLPRDRWVARDGYRIWYGQSRASTRPAPYHAPMLRAPLDEALADSDLLHLQLGLTLVNVLGRRRAQAHGLPYLYTPRGVLCPHRLRDRGWSKRLFLHAFERRIVHGAAALHALTPKERDDLLGQGGEPARIHVIPNGIDMGDPATWPSGEPFREAHGIASDAPLVLFLGRLQRVKGLDLLLEAFAAARRDVPGLTLALAGPDEGAAEAARRQAARLGVDDAVRFTGKVDGVMRLSAFRAADVFALTSYSEGLPVAVLEACAIGAPVLLTDRCNLPEVAEARAGRVEPADAGRLTAALREMLADRAELAAMGERARRMIDERFAITSVVGRIEMLYRQVLGQAAAAGHAEVVGHG